MILAVRVDDIGWTPEKAAHRSGKTSDGGLSLARKFHDAMSGIPYLAAVIPSALDDEGKAWLKSKPEGMTIAGHGMLHDSLDGGESEFWNWKVHEVVPVLEQARAILGDTPHFVPPFNYLNDGMTDACLKTGFRYIWGQHQEAISLPYSYRGTTFVPAWSHLYGATTMQMGPTKVPILYHLPRIRLTPGAAVITLHITWEAAAHDDFFGVKKLSEMLKSFDVVTPDEWLRECAKRQ